ncbi:hypothetical protein GCM10009836_01430 [Pseudonocardia ailaonensis]|uniref:ABC transmembrane type-1 domain-containing protein n=1 Tax=Pseudonocardia ailaonensis TaxID=367279 RepID=A0ABN2MIY5_9PSEU
MSELASEPSTQAVGLVPTEPQEQVEAAGTAPRRRGWGPIFWVCVAWLAVVIVLALFGGALGLADYGAKVGPPRAAPSTDSLSTLLGTDSVGRSVLSRIAAGGRVSLVVGLVATAIGLTIGVLLGMLAAYFRGWVEAVIAVLTDSVLAFPPLILLLAVAAVVKPSLTTLILSLGGLVIPGFVRLMKANALQVLGREYITAAHAIGASTGRVLFRDVLPNAFFPLLSYSLLVVATMMVAEGSLSFLGLGIPPPYPSWGGMVSAGRGDIADAPLTVLAPAVVLFLTVFSLNTLGDRLRKRFALR